MRRIIILALAIIFAIVVWRAWSLFYGMRRFSQMEEC